MKIIIVCPRLCHGGAERVAVSLANGFVSQGYDVVFFADLFEEQTYILDDAVRIFNLVSSTKNKIRKWGSAIRIIRRVVKKEKPDVIIGIMSLCSLIAKIASLGMGVPVIATEHDSYERPNTAPMSLWTKLYKYFICKIYERVTVLTNADKQVIGHRLNNVIVMPNPLAITPSATVPSKKNVILAAGRVDNWHYKGFDVLIRAWARVVSSSLHSEAVEPSDKNQVSKELKPGTTETCIQKQVEGLQEPSTWRLQIAGVWRDPKTRDYLDSIAKECGVQDQIDYLGFVKDMESLYKQSSIFVLSSRYEGFGLVLIEAMSQGCACVACDYKGRQREIFEELKDGRIEELKSGSYEECKNGILCPPDDVEALAEGIKRMMEDEEYRKEVQRNSIERSMAYSIDQTIQRWEQMLNQIVN